MAHALDILVKLTFQTKATVSAKYKNMKMEESKNTKYIGNFLLIVQLSAEDQEKCS